MKPANKNLKIFIAQPNKAGKQAIYTPVTLLGRLETCKDRDPIKAGYYELVPCEAPKPIEK